MKERPQEHYPEKNELPEHWRLAHIAGTGSRYFERDDYAYVLYSDNNFNSRPWLDGHKPWIAFPPPPPGVNPDRDFWSQLTYRPTLRVRGRFPSRLLATRRWKTAVAAMRAVDEEFPLEVVARGERA